MTPVDVQEFIPSIGSQPPPRVVLLCPEKRPRAREATFEPLLAERAVERLLDAYLDPSLKDLAYSAFYADENDPGEIVLEAQTLPFVAERRVVLVRNAEHYKAESAARPLLEYLEAPNESTLLILIAAHVDKRTKFYKLCEKAGVVVGCPTLGEREAAQWVRAEVEAKGKAIEPAATEELVRRAGTHLGDVSNALNVVATFIGDAPTIREQDVMAACADVAEEEIWALTDAIAGSRPADAIAALRKLTDLGKHQDEILGTINWLLKSAYTVATPNSTRPPVSRFVANKVRPLAAKLGLEKLRAAFALCTDTHFMMRSTGVDAALALELLVVKLAAPARRQRAAT